MNKYLILFQTLHSIRLNVFSYERTPADVKEVIKHAKLHESELTDITQTLRFTSDNTNSENLKILQLDQHVLDELVVGATVTFKGIFPIGIHLGKLSCFISYIFYR